MATEPPAPDLGAPTLEQRQTLVRLRYELEHARSQGYTTKPMLLADVQMALDVCTAQATRLAAVEQLLQEADITCSCCQSWVETLQAALHAGAVGAAEETHEQ